MYLLIIWGKIKLIRKDKVNTYNYFILFRKKEINNNMVIILFGLFMLGFGWETWKVTRKREENIFKSSLPQGSPPRPVCTSVLPAARPPPPSTATTHTSPPPDLLVSAAIRLFLSDFLVVWLWVLIPIKIGLKALLFWIQTSLSEVSFICFGQCLVMKTDTILHYWRSNKELEILLKHLLLPFAMTMQFFQLH